MTENEMLLREIVAELLNAWELQDDDDAIDAVDTLVRNVKALIKQERLEV